MSCCQSNRWEKFHIHVQQEDAFVIAVAGNPNVGKSTLFNALTGLRQHTGNWPGKTVSQAYGTFDYQDVSFLLVDLPGTYSLLSHSTDEQVARDFLCFGQPDLTLVVLDATALERNLNLALQVLEITPKVIVCVNLMDEADRKGIHIDLERLSMLLGVPAVGMSARSGEGIVQLKETIMGVLHGRIACVSPPLTYSAEIEQAIAEIEPELKQLLKGSSINSRWVALRLIDGDETILASIADHLIGLQQNACKEVHEPCHNSVILD